MSNQSEEVMTSVHTDLVTSNRTKIFASPFSLLCFAYFLSMAVVWIGIVHTTGMQFWFEMLNHLVSFAVISALAIGIAPSARIFEIRRPRYIAEILFALAVIVAITHWFVLGGLPLLRALKAADPKEVMRIRQSIIDHGAFFNYASTFLIKAVFPVVVLQFLIDKRFALAITTFIFGVIYATSMMQKSLPLFLAVPPLIYLLGSRMKLAAFSVFAVATSAVIASATIANIYFTGVLLTLFNRIFLVPGETVSVWLEAFHEGVFPFEHGCGYRFLAAFLKCPFVNNSELIWHYVYKDTLLDQGISGTMNAAHFAEEYANFGTPGIVLSSLLVVSVIFVAVAVTSRLGSNLSFAVNLPFVATLTSTALHTTLLSGGWAAMLVLSFVVLRPQLGHPAGRLRSAGRAASVRPTRG